MNQTNTLMVAILIAFGVILVAGLVVIPTIEQAAHASNAISDSRNKGQRGFDKSGGQGGSSCTVCE